ncbi:unnamed protein product [Rotaria magnacalcarata]|uniref:cyclin-dependent kinase n=3 Tax=Rotaria magnacalcarata TaxID=392030 RepID=A0A814EE93_9BILA|nr:unnamed protein product [Rotaria magnacalcarata]CAF1571955.1 unnamed protein product [Rotaria magnacalcarata]CAF2113197.1 unnamed protein product [Rotaria magnacalcarata]CAF2118870.1 unnamed protein product [Rotaria magnacalcarata]CAF4069943.1 unnamed protein product [Rotaria magnacalcarata]
MAGTLVLDKNEFKLLDQIGSGTYAKVYKAFDYKHQREVAIKCMLLDSERYGLLCVVIREINLLLELKHPNIIHLYDVIRRENEIYLIFECMNTDLYQYMIHNQRPLADIQVKVYFYQLLNGLEFCHTNKIFHRDLKPQNLLLDKKGTLKIADFGLARDETILKRAYSKDIVTLWYRPPEVLLGIDIYSSSVDIWSAGCIFAEMLRRAPLFKGDCEISQLFCIFQVLGTPTEKLWPGVSSLSNYNCDFPQWPATSSLSKYVHLTNDKAEDILTRCLSYPPEQRLTAKQALQHPYFSQEEEPISL